MADTVTTQTIADTSGIKYVVKVFNEEKKKLKMDIPSNHVISKKNRRFRGHIYDRRRK